MFIRLYIVVIKCKLVQTKEEFSVLPVINFFSAVTSPLDNRPAYLCQVDMNFFA